MCSLSSSRAARGQAGKAPPPPPPAASAAASAAPAAAPAAAAEQSEGEAAAEPAAEPEANGHAAEENGEGEESEASSAATAPAAVPPQLPCGVRLLVDSSQIGYLVGKGGSTIKATVAQSGAAIRILPKAELPPCACVTDEIVLVSCSAGMDARGKVAGLLGGPVGREKAVSGWSWVWSWVWSMGAWGLVVFVSSKKESAVRLGAVQCSSFTSLQVVFLAGKQSRAQHSCWFSFVSVSRERQQRVCETDLSIAKRGPR